MSNVITTARFNETLPKGHVIVAIDDKYSDNDGPYHIAYIWDGDKVYIVNYSNGYTKYAHHDGVVDATPEQHTQACNWHRDHVPPRDCEAGLIGHRFTVKRSRKVKKGSLVEVREFYRGGYDATYGNWVNDQVRVKVIESEHGQEDQHFTISSGCLDEWKRGTLPWWN